MASLNPVKCLVCCDGFFRVAQIKNEVDQVNFRLKVFCTYFCSTFISLIQQQEQQEKLLESPCDQFLCEKCTGTINNLCYLHSQIDALQKEIQTIVDCVTTKIVETTGGSSSSSADLIGLKSKKNKINNKNDKSVTSVDDIISQRLYNVIGSKNHITTDFPKDDDELGKNEEYQSSSDLGLEPKDEPSSTESSVSNCDDHDLNNYDFEETSNTNMDVLINEDSCQDLTQNDNDEEDPLKIILNKRSYSSSSNREQNYSNKGEEATIRIKRKARIVAETVMKTRGVKRRLKRQIRTRSTKILDNDDTEDGSSSSDDEVVQDDKKDHDFVPDDWSDVEEKETYNDGSGQSQNRTTEDLESSLWRLIYDIETPEPGIYQYGPWRFEEVESKLRCCECQKLFKNKNKPRDVARHINAVHILIREKKKLGRPRVSKTKPDDQGIFHYEGCTYEEIGTNHFKCGLCGTKRKGKHSIKWHINHCHNSKAHICEKCQRTYSTEKKLKTHKCVVTSSMNNKYRYKMVHLGDNKYVYDGRWKIEKCGDGPEDGFTCGTCNLKKSSISLITAHIREEHFEVKEPYICETCGYVAKKHYILKRHQVKHNTSLDFICEVCGAAFKHGSLLHSHRQRHRPEGYKCECGNIYKHPSALQRHCRDTGHSTTEPKRQLQVDHECPKCSKFWVTQKSLDLHIPKCTGKLPIPEFFKKRLDLIDDSNSVQEEGGKEKDDEGQQNL